MDTKRKSFCIVCIANYCRSPVFEALLEERFQGEYEFFSAGISPAHKPNMDPRSIEFLKNNNIPYKIHTPKRLNKRMLNYFDHILAVDAYVLFELNRLYRKYSHKISLITSYYENVDIIDPFKFDLIKYNEVMEKISFIAKDLDLEKF